MIWKNLIIFLSCRSWWRWLRNDHQIFYFSRFVEKTNFLSKILFELLFWLLQNVEQICHERDDFFEMSNQLIRNFALKLVVLALNTQITIMILKKILVIDNYRNDCKKLIRSLTIDMIRSETRILLKNFQDNDLCLHRRLCFDTICARFDERFISWWMWKFWY